MNPEPVSSSPRKVKFAPKGPPRRKPRPVQPKSEMAEEEDDEAARQALLRRVNEHLGRHGSNVKKNSPVQVTFTHGVVSSTSLKTYELLRGVDAEKSDLSILKNSASGSDLAIIPSTSIAGVDRITKGSENAAVASSQEGEQQQYREPWDYNHSYYPTTLPLRRPYSGDPELLDEAEFGDAAATLEYDENIIHSASELGLLEENDREQLLFLQLPANLPLLKRVASADEGKMDHRLNLLGNEGASDSAKRKEPVGSPKFPGEMTGAAANLQLAKRVASADEGKMEHKLNLSGKGGASDRAMGKEPAESSQVSGGMAASAGANGKKNDVGVISPGFKGMPSSSKGKQTTGSSTSSAVTKAPKMGCSLEELPGGYMGKMLVYKSGAVKLKLGETLYDVAPGSKCTFSQHVAAVNTLDRNFSVVGELHKRAVVTPDLDFLDDIPI